MVISEKEIYTMFNKVVCPSCNNDKFTEPSKTWQYGIFTVGQYICGECRTKFRFFDSPKSFFTIPKPTNKKIQK